MVQSVNEIPFVDKTDKEGRERLTQQYELIDRIKEKKLKEKELLPEEIRKPEERFSTFDRNPFW